MSSRNEILRRLQGPRTDSKIALPEIKSDADIFHDFPVEDTYRTFCQRFERLNGELIEARDQHDAVQHLEKLLTDAPVDSCLIQDAPALQKILDSSQNLAAKTVVMTEDYYSGERLAPYKVGISLAGYLVARTGSMIIDSMHAGGRLLSVLPPAHIVIATEKQIVPSLEHAFNKIEVHGIGGSFVSIISGPSRTSDIEKELVLGAHGPRRLILILIRAGK